MSSAWGAKSNNNAKVLDRFKCRICNIFKSSDNYSNKELNDYRQQVARGSKLDGITAKLRCKGCNGALAQELECEGPCGETKVLNDFSKTQRRNGENWCKSCVNWKEFQEPGLFTETAPGEADYTVPAGFDGVGHEDDGFIAVPYDFDKLSVSAVEASRASTSLASAPHTIQTRGAHSVSVPPHLRGGNGAGSISSASNVYETLSSISSPSGPTIAKQRDPIAYVGYDRAGRPHDMQKDPSESQDLASSIVTSSRTASSRTERAYSGKGNGIAAPAPQQTPAYYNPFEPNQYEDEWF